mgnify:CR=1 FL=1
MARTQAEGGRVGGRVPKPRVGRGGAGGQQKKRAALEAAGGDRRRRFNGSWTAARALAAAMTSRAAGRRLHARPHIAPAPPAPAPRPVSLVASLVRLKMRRDAVVPEMYEYSTKGAEDALPARWKAHGLFWLVSHTLAFLLRPSRLLAQKVETHSRQLHLQSLHLRPILAVHARRTDACRPYTVLGRRRRCDPLEAYVAAARQLVEQHGFRSILLLSDSPSAVRNASRAFRSLPVVVLTRGDALAAATRWQIAAKAERAAAAAARQWPRRKAGWLAREAAYPLTSETKAGHERALDFLTDVHLIGRCDGFVGKFSSSLGRIGYSLMAARAPFGVRPYLSLDVPWCFGLGCRKEGSEALKKMWRKRERQRVQQRDASHVP